MEVFPGLFENVPNKLSLGLVPGSQVQEDRAGMTWVEREDYTIPRQLFGFSFTKLRLNRLYGVGVLICGLGGSGRRKETEGGRVIISAKKELRVVYAS